MKKISDELYPIQQFSSNNLSSEQCDSLGPNTEKLLLGSLLTPDESSVDIS